MGWASEAWCLNAGRSPVCDVGAAARCRTSSVNQPTTVSAANPGAGQMWARVRMYDLRYGEIAAIAAMDRGTPYGIRTRATALKARRRTFRLSLNLDVCAGQRLFLVGTVIGRRWLFTNPVWAKCGPPFNSRMAREISPVTRPSRCQL